MKIWINRSNQTYGPYQLKSIREWQLEEKVHMDDLGWDLENKQWVALVDLLDRLEGGVGGILPSKEEDSESKVEKIQMLLDSKNEELALDLLLPDPCPLVFETLIKGLSIYRFGDYCKFVCANRFEFELLSNCPPEANISVSDGVQEYFKTNSLKSLGLKSSWIVQSDNFQFFSNLRELDLTLDEECDLTFLAYLPGLLSLSLSCKESGFVDLKALAPLENLEKLFVYNAHNLSSIEPIRNMKKIRSLHLVNCPKLESLAPLDSCVGLKELTLSDSGSGFAQVNPIGSLIELEILSLSGWKELKSLDGLENLVDLKEIDLSYCKVIDRIDPLFELQFLDKVKGCQAPWTPEAFVFMVEKKVPLDFFRREASAYEDGPELIEEMLSSFSQLNSNMFESMSNEIFYDLVYFAFECAETFNLKNWNNSERDALGDSVFNQLADAASGSIENLLCVAKFNFGQWYSHPSMAIDCINRAISTYKQAENGLACIPSFLEICDNNYPEGISFICQKIIHFDIMDMEIWDHEQWTDDFESYNGYSLHLPDISEFTNLESFKLGKLLTFPDGLENLKNLIKLTIDCYQGEDLTIPESLINLKEIRFEEAENLRNLNDLSVFPNLEILDLQYCGCYLKKPDWLGKIDSEKVEILLPEEWDDEQ